MRWMDNEQCTCKMNCYQLTCSSSGNNTLQPMLPNMNPGWSLDQASRPLPNFSTTYTCIPPSGTAPSDRIGLGSPTAQRAIVATSLVPLWAAGGPPCTTSVTIHLGTSPGETKDPRSRGTLFPGDSRPVLVLCSGQ